jgi:hypothetical protein
LPWLFAAVHVLEERVDDVDQRFDGHQLSQQCEDTVTGCA